MMRTMTVVKQYLAAAFFILIGLIASSCGDTASVSPVVELAGLTVTTATATATLQPAFNPATTNYTVNLSDSITTVTVTAQPAVDGDSVTINSQATRSRAITLDPPGETTIVNVVVSETGTNSRTYVIRLVRADLTGNNSLQSLTVSQGTLAPPFNEITEDYTVDVANIVGSVNVTPTLDDPIATMTVNGQPASSGQARTINLNPAGQLTNITIVVTAQNSNNKTYRVTVSRGISINNNLQNLTISPGTLNFRANVTSYNVVVASNVTSVTVTPTRQDPTATLTVTSNGHGPITTSGQARTIPLRAAGLSTIINITVTAQNGSGKPYTITVDREAPPPPSGNNNLSALTVTPGPLAPTFTSGNTIYSVDVVATVTNVTVTPTRQDPAATLTVTSNGPGPITTSGQARTIPLRDPGLSTIINITVTAPNGSQKSYAITVDRATPPPPSGNNNLSALRVTPPGTPLPGFGSSTLTYTVNVGGDVQSVTVTATLQDTAASMTINGTGTSSGVASAPITLGEPGSEIAIPIVVIAPNGASKTYTIAVRKRPPAPDLVEEDDSCLPDSSTTTGCAPGTSKNDNITNVAIPRFRMLLPSGPGPSLFVDGSTVPVEFDQGANTLKPTTPLPDGVHSIRYTVTNSAGLVSAQSDLLTVTIDTVAPGGP